MALPRRIGVEVTETAVIDNLDGAVTHLRRLQAHGIRIFLDDFGTGYSSLSYLGRLPVDVLKVDKQFVYDGMTSLRGKGLLATMIDLARNLDISVIAEGVETQAQLQILRDLGCTLIQGYHIARPLTEKAALAWPEPL
jgi:EAL domain-containing protein (putative c-di-GMP-specific phosphodiesterase class I)